MDDAESVSSEREAAHSDGVGSDGEGSGNDEFGNGGNMSSESEEVRARG